MQNKKTYQQWLMGVPKNLLIIAAGLILIGLLSSPLITGMSDKDKIDNVLLTGIPFILIFVAVVFIFVFLILLANRLLSNNIPPRAYQTIEFIIIGGVVLGVVGMFQPWFLIGYQWGFLLLLLCFLTFNVWSHINPKRGG